MGRDLQLVLEACCGVCPCQTANHSGLICMQYTGEWNLDLSVAGS